MESACSTDSQACQYKCDASKGYEYKVVGGKGVCVVNGQCGSAATANVDGKPTATNLCAKGDPSPTTLTQTANGWSRVCKGVNGGNDSPTCNATCRAGYIPSGTTCFQNEKPATCTGLPANAVRSSTNSNAPKSITQTLNGGVRTPSEVGTPNTATTANACYYKCNAGYTPSGTPLGSSCIQSCDASFTLTSCPAGANCSSCGGKHKIDSCKTGRERPSDGNCYYIAKCGSANSKTLPKSTYGIDGV